MTNSIDKLNDQLEKHNNVLLYKQELLEYYKIRNKKIPAVYIISPRKGKTAIESIVKALDNTSQTRNKSISKLIEQIRKEVEDKTLHIYIDNFEKLSNRELEYYSELVGIENIQLIVNLSSDTKFIDEDFLKKFIILNPDDYNDNRSQSVSVTYPILLLLTLIVFLAFLRLQLSILNILVSTVWFSFLMYRSFTYMVR